MNKEIWIGIILTAAIAGGVSYYYGLWPRPQPRSEARSEPTPSATQTPPAAAPIQYPVPDPELPASLPALADSDDSFFTALTELYGKPPVDTYLVPKNLIARLVATVDSLDRADPVAMKTRAIPAVPQAPVLDRAGGKTYLSPKNSARYQPLVSALQAVDGKAVAELYLRWYPLFQEAYRELGYPDGYFNDRLIQVIDHLLETPDLKGPHEVVRPTVAWRFADADLEQRSSGQKILLRLGLDHAGVVKTKLQEIRAVIAQQRRDPA